MTGLVSYLARARAAFQAATSTCLLNPPFYGYGISLRVRVYTSARLPYDVYVRMDGFLIQRT